MVGYIRFTMRSGRRYEVEIDVPDGKTLEDMALKFTNEVDFSNVEVMRAGRAFIFTREIEAIEFTGHSVPALRR